MKKNNYFLVLGLACGLLFFTANGKAQSLGGLNGNLLNSLSEQLNAGNSINNNNRSKVHSQLIK